MKINFEIVYVNVYEALDIHCIPINVLGEQTYNTYKEAQLVGTLSDKYIRTIPIIQ